jgi:hypothetical protein
MTMKSMPDSLHRGAGLRRGDLNAWRQFHITFFVAPEMRVGATALRFTPSEGADANTTLKPKCIGLTRAGEELLRIANTAPAGARSWTPLRLADDELSDAWRLSRDMLVL